MHLLEDIRAYKKNDPAARSAIEVMLLYNGLHATIDYRIAHWFYLRRCFFIARAISQWSKMWTGIEIHPGATIGRRLVIDHGTGIVIGETAEIGDDCLLYQGVTLGGTGKDIGKLATNGLVVLNDIDQRHGFRFPLGCLATIMDAKLQMFTARGAKVTELFASGGVLSASHSQRWRGPK